MHNLSRMRKHPGIRLQEMWQLRLEKSTCEGGMDIATPRFHDKWERIAWEYRHARATMSSFYCSLCAAIVIADLENTARLRKAFPELVNELKGEPRYRPLLTAGECMKVQTDLEGNHLGSQDPPWKGICCEQCWNAKGKRCTCSCGGAFHGIGHARNNPAMARQKHLEGPDVWIPTHDQAQPFLDQLQTTRCPDCGESLKGEVILAYPHEHGWTVEGCEEKQWLFIRCPKCEYPWALWKLGVRIQ